MTRLQRLLSVAFTLTLVSAPLAAQADPSLLSVRSIYASPDFSGERFGPTRWLENGAAYTTLEKSTEGKGRDIVRYATESAARTVLVPAAAITAPGDTAALDVEDYSWSPDGTKLLIFTNSQPVWRQNNRGDYWVLDRTSRQAPEAGRRRGEAVDAAVRQVLARWQPHRLRAREQHLRRGPRHRCDHPGHHRRREALINGTFDWVYEEELDLRDGWRWSPDGQRIAYWQLEYRRRAELRHHQRHRFTLLLRDAGAVPQGRRIQLRGARGCGERFRWAHGVAAVRGRPA